MNQTSSPPFVLWLITAACLFACSTAARSDEWVSCRREGASGQFIWMRGKSTHNLINAEFRPSASSPDVGQCLVSNEQLREAHGLMF